MPKPSLRRGARSLLLLAALGYPGAATAQRLSPVAPADLSRLSPSDFADDELNLPYYLAHFHRLANAVRDSGESRGFIDLPVWRAVKDNRPYNARIMENVLSLAFFYTADRPWNPYRGDPALRARLEAALDFWVRSQSPDGRFSEYAPAQWSLAPTAFATKFMGETLRLLRDGPPVDPGLHRRVVEADRKAILAVLTDTALYRHGRSYSNQYGNVWAGGLAYLDLYPDAELERLLREQMRRAAPDHQSPVGFYYEADGPDWGYNLGTHHSNVHMAWHYARGTPLGDALQEETRRWYEWFAYNAVPEPDGSGFTLNRGIEARQKTPFVADAGQDVSEAGFPLAEEVELARVLGTTRETLAGQRATRRAELRRRWPEVDPLVLGEFSAFSPYAFLHRSQAQWRPTAEQRRAALARLPYLARDRFTHQRVDTRRPTVFTFVRRPAYYAAFNAGEIIRPQQRYGLGLLWTREAGALLQSQTDAGDAAWGTRAADSAVVYEARSFNAAFRVGGAPVDVRPGNRDLPAGDLETAYPLADRGRKTVRFDDQGVHVEVTHAGAFVEQIPLLVLPGERIERSPGRVELRRGGTRLVLRFDPAAEVTIRRTGEGVGAREVAAVLIPGTGELRYSLEIGSATDSR